MRKTKPGSKDSREKAGIIIVALTIAAVIGLVCSLLGLFGSSGGT